MSEQILAEMAQEHRLIAKHANAVEAAVQANRQIEAITALGHLHATVSAHFAGEEAVMARLGYDDLDAHRAAHRAMMSGLDAIRRAIEGERLGHLERGLADYVAQAARHIAEHDEPLRAFLAGER